MKKRKKTSRVPALGDTSRRWWKATKGEKRPKMKFSKGKVLSDESAFQKMMQYFQDTYKEDKYTPVYAETISAVLNIRENIVRKVLMRMNREGFCSTRIIWDSRTCLGAMHTRLDWHGDCPVQWEAKSFSLYVDKIQEFKCTHQKK